ncbi:MAG: class I SAM-dependent methyltransferase [Nanoarchaeota archaeon]
MKCPICYNTHFKRIFFMKEIARWNNKKYPLFKCTKCGLVRPNPLPYTEISKFPIYDSDDNLKFYNPKTKRIDFGDAEYKDYFKHFLQYVYFVKKYKIKGKHLDVGCGAGHIIQLLFDAGLNSEGLEISKKLFNSLKLRYKVHCSELNRLSSKYNLITLSHVLEHIINLEQFVKELNKHLYTKGFVIVSIPYIKGIVPRLLRTKWYGLGHGQHLNLFSKKSLKLLFEKNGFKILEFKIGILDYTHKRFPKPLNLGILFISELIEYTLLGDNLYMVAIKSNNIK